MSHPGIDKVAFSQIAIDSLLGIAIRLVTNRYVDTYYHPTNFYLTNQTVERVSGLPDILFTAGDLTVVQGVPLLMSRPTFANSATALGTAAGELLPGSLEREIRRIYERSPIYGQRFPLHAEPLRWACYREIPALDKKTIIERGHQAFFADYGVIERGLQESRYEYEATSGTTQGPMTVIMEDGWWNAQTVRAYRASPILRPFTGRPYRKCVLAPVGCSSNLCPYEDHPFPHRYFDGTVYLNLSSDPFAFPEGEWDRIVTELQAVKPEVLEGEPVYLSLLARAAQRRGVAVPSLRAVILTYGKASSQHGRRIAEVFPAAVEVVCRHFVTEWKAVGFGGR